MFEIDINNIRFLVDVTRYISDKPHNGPASTCDTLDDMLGNTEIEFEVIRATDLNLDEHIDNEEVVNKMTAHYYTDISTQLISLISAQANDNIIRGFK